MKKKYVVTDPCYILSNKVWGECCKLLQDPADEAYKAFNTAVAGELTKLSGSQAWASDTGYGDWNNNIFGPGVIHNNFFADAGMVCVCLLTPEIEIKLDLGNGNNGVAVFETEDIESVEFDTEDEYWTIVKIKTKEGLIESEYNNNEDEEEYEDPWEDDEDEDY